MRFAALLAILGTLPLIMAWIKGGDKRRDIVVGAAAALALLTGSLEVSAALVVWPAWNGIAKGIIISMVDIIAISLILTRNARFNRAYYWPLILIYVIPNVVSIIPAPAKMPAIFYVGQLAQMLLIFVAFSGELQRPSAVKSLLKGLSVGLIIQAGYVVFQKANGIVQASGTMPHQNIMGIVVELAALPLIAAILEGEKSKLVYAGSASSCLIIAAGGSRGSILYFAIGLALVLIISIIRRNTPRKWKIAGLAVLTCIASAPLALGTLNERFQGASITTQETQRAAFERAAKSMASDHILGVGANNFVSVNNIQGYAARAGLDWAPALRSQPAHNAFLVARAESGWMGQLTFVLMIAGFVIAGITISFRNKKDRQIGVLIGSAVGIFCAAVHSNYEYALLTSNVQKFLFFNAAIISGGLLYTKNRPYKLGNKDRNLNPYAQYVVRQNSPSVISNIRQ